MNRANDLVTDYQSMSNEQPSEFTNALILKAASNALEKDKKQKSTHRWHLPVSIAAGAVFTVTIVTQLDPWGDATFDGTYTAPATESIVTPAPIEDPTLMGIAEDLTQPFEQQIQTRGKLQQKQQTNQKIKKSVTIDSLLSSPKVSKPSKLRQSAIPHLSPSVRGNLSADSTSVSSSPSTLIDDQLTVIEYYIDHNKFTLANKNLRLLLNTNKYDSLTATQKQRISYVRKTLQQSLQQ